MKPYLLFFILLFCQFIAYGQKAKTDGIFVFDGGKNRWYDNEFFVRFCDADSLIFGQLKFPDDRRNDSLGQYLNGLTYVKRAYQRSDDKISFVEEMIHDSKIIEYKILLTSDTTLWLNSDDISGSINEVPIRFNFINVDNLDRNIMFVDTHVYKIISHMPHPNSSWLNMHENVTNAIRKIEASDDYEKCTTTIYFTVLEDGRCTDWKIHRSTCWDLAEYILEEFKKTSPWEPGSHIGRRVKCRYTIPFTFRN